MRTAQAGLRHPHHAADGHERPGGQRAREREQAEAEGRADHEGGFKRPGAGRSLINIDRAGSWLTLGVFAAVMLRAQLREDVPIEADRHPFVA